DPPSSADRYLCADDGDRLLKGTLARNLGRAAARLDGEKMPVNVVGVVRVGPVSFICHHQHDLLPLLATTARSPVGETSATMRAPSRSRCQVPQDGSLLNSAASLTGALSARWFVFSLGLAGLLHRCLGFLSCHQR